MRTPVVFRVLGVLLMVFSATMLVPTLVSVLYQDGASAAFLIAFSITFSTGLACWLFTRINPTELGIRDGFVVTVLFWTVLGFYGALPLMLEERLQLGFTDAVFESISGFPPSVLFVVIQTHSGSRHKSDLSDPYRRSSL